MRAKSRYHLAVSATRPLMMSGVRASSMRMESTSSTMAKAWPALHHVFGPHRHVVAQVVEPELVVGAVGDVGAVGGTPFVGLVVALDEPDGQAEESMDVAHPLGVALGQVVVDGDDVHALAAETVEVARHRGNERLALTGPHLGDHPAVERSGADDLDIEVTLSQHPLGGLADHRIGLGLDVVEGLACLQPVAELIGLGPQLSVGERLDRRFEGVDGLDEDLELFEFLALTDVEDLLEHRHDRRAILTVADFGL